MSTSLSALSPVVSQSTKSPRRTGPVPGARAGSARGRRVRVSPAPPRLGVMRPVLLPNPHPAPEGRVNAIAFSGYTG